MSRLSAFVRSYAGKSKHAPGPIDHSRVDQRQQELTVSKIVAPDDHMFSSGPDWYYSVGESGLNACLNALKQAGRTDVRRVLDIPCGHGRVARHLRTGFPEATMYYCDLDRSGVDFCARELQGHGIYSAPELAGVDLPFELDLIWVGSLSPMLTKIAPAAGSVI